MMAAVLTLVLLAAPSEAVSRAHFAKAQKAFAQHDWKRALEEFTATGESTPSELPDLWFDIAQCHRNLGHTRQAIAAYDRYLALKPEAPDRDKVRSLIVALGGRVSDDPAPAPAAVVGAALDEPTPGPAIAIDPKPLAAVAAIAAPASVPLIATPDAAPQKAHRRWKVWTGVAVGVAAVALGVGLGVGLGMSSSSGGASQQPAIPSLGSAATFDTRGH